jgi:hypothetical protein
MVGGAVGDIQCGFQFPSYARHTSLLAGTSIYAGSFSKNEFSEEYPKAWLTHSQTQRRHGTPS